MSQEDVEVRAKERLERRIVLRRKVRTLPCPQCKVKEDNPCLRIDGSEREANHIARHREAKGQGLV